jgi:large subunit ribosomal protein L15
MNLHDLRPAPGARRTRKRVGRGPGSGLGKTSARGEKGQRSRSGYSSRPGFEGGQMPIVRRLPKRGFTPPFREGYRTVNVGRLNGLEAGTIVTPESLEEAGLLRRGAGRVKVLGDGELGVALTVRAHKFSASAAERIRAAGGSAETLAVRTPAPIQRKPKVARPKRRS